VTPVSNASSLSAVPAWRGSTPLILALGLAAIVVSMALTQVVPTLSLLGRELHTSAEYVTHPDYHPST